MKVFVETYGEERCRRPNFHSTYHLPRWRELFGNLRLIWAAPYENSHLRIKNAARRTNKKNVLPQLAKLLSLHRFEQLYPEQAEKVLLPKQCSPALALSEEQKRIRPKQSMDQISSRNDVCLQVNAWRS
eukprot:TRINITY_DN518_c0_g1_i16.p4 TRINITY_DN518_c0_g1~~TRINITY_DN518_c0_g1_i16.p4  ORF type:complete len:129 (+),score=24.51 TRINITY_DN518_c0_g1_i16:693-1079(+)